MAVTGRRPTITSSATASGDILTTPSITITANFTITELATTGDNLQIVDGTVQPIANATAGVYTGTVTAKGANNMEASQDVSITLNSVAPTLLPPTNIAFNDISQRYFDVTYTDAASATSYELMVDGNEGGRVSITASDTRIIVDTPNRPYNIQMRSTDGTNFSVWSATHTVTTLADDVDPDPEGTVPRRLAEVNAAMCMQWHTNWQQATSVHSDYNNPDGWLHKYARDLAAEGVRRQRTSLGQMAAIRTISRLAYSSYGIRPEFTLSDNRDATGPDSPQEVMQYAAAANRFVVNGTFIINSIQGLNEPNNPHKAYDVNYRQDVLRSMNAWLNEMDDNDIWDDTYRLPFSPWGRSHYVHLGVRFADGLGTWRSQTTDPGPVNEAPYVYQGLTWDEDIAPRIEGVNLHLYTGGREPTIAGTPGTVLDENGSKVTQISLDDTLHQLRTLKGATPHWYSGGEDRKLSVPYSCTEGGWHHQGPGAINPNMVRDNNWSYVTSNVQSKYNLRSHFEHMLRGMGTDYRNHYVWYEFLDNPSESGNIYGAINWARNGSVFTYQPRPVYYAQLYLARACRDLAGNSRTFTVTPLNFSLGNPPGQSGQYTPKIHHILFQRSDGVWFLIIWFDHESWNRTMNDPAGTEDFQSRTVRLTFNDGNKKVRSFRPYLLNNPNNASSWTTYNSFNPVGAVNLTVPDDPLIVQITP